MPISTTNGRPPAVPDRKRRRLLRALALAPLGAAAGTAAAAGETGAVSLPLAGAEGLQVLHWWNSVGERKAVEVISTRLQQEHIIWRDGLIPNGSGVGAGIVLRSRMLARDAPEVAQLNGIVIRDWARLHLLLNLDAVADADRWQQQLQPTVAELIQQGGQVVAAPLGIHRINTLFYNRALFSRYHLSAPLSWDDFERAAERLQRAGVVPLAQSSEPWQVATLFETLVLAEGGAAGGALGGALAGAAFHRDLFQHRKAQAFADPRLGAALQRLRRLKRWMRQPVPERSWDQTTRELAEGTGAMMVMGDWAKGELNAWGLATDIGFGWTPVPGTARVHLYNVDTLTMLATRESHRAAQLTLAGIVMSPAVQSEYNLIKGSIPVLRYPALGRMDSCSLASYKLFSSSRAAQVPSLVHRMAADETVRDAMVAELHHFFMDETVTVADAQRRLSAIGRTLTKTR
ncbi:MAG: ABC transporter substrate-binding protein [Pseudomonadota bacterium]